LDTEEPSLTKIAYLDGDSMANLIWWFKNARTVSKREDVRFGCAESGEMLAADERASHGRARWND
jgi:hypothetical protein